MIERKEPKNIQLTTKGIRETKMSRADFLNQTRNEIYVISDGIHNGYNLGSLFRVCDATLVKKIIIVGDKIDMNLKIKKAAKGTEHWVPYEFTLNPVETVTRLKEAGVQIISIELCKDSVDYRLLDQIHGPLCFIFGNEMEGVSEELLRVSDYRLHLPQSGMANSLNVANCASIILYEGYKKMKPLRNPLKA